MQEAGDFIITPHGLVHNDCVHHVEEDDRTEYKPHPCSPKDSRILRPKGPAGWIESATFTPSEPLKSMCVKFTVPEPPSRQDESLIYLFPGAENARGSTILQPVLQWGNNRKFGGAHWTIVSWHCTPEGHSRHSNHHEVFPGQTVHASIRVDGETPDACDWIVEAKVDEEPEKHARLRVCNEEYLMLFLIGAALEAYSLPSGDPLRPVKENCGLLPGSETVFRDIKLRDLNCNTFRCDWGGRWPDVCGFGVDVSANKDRITLTYC